MAFKSHSKETIRAALAAGKTVWDLDTGSSGNDDHIIGEDYDMIVEEILGFFEIDKFPKTWRLTAVNKESIQEDWDWDWEV